jgi:tRNA/tmRNA/rRNA uracil-C5-methylase (TrmA/RlmC/RlmD family)
MDDRREFSVKSAAVAEFWRRSLPDAPCRGLLPTPSARGYRTVTKRKASVRAGKVRLGLIDPSEKRSGGILEVGTCAIEPPAHHHVYAVCRTALGDPALRALAEEILYVIVKGTGEAQTVILSVRATPPPVIRAVNVLSKRLTRECSSIAGVFVYTDRSDARYYLGEADPRRLRKVYGADLLRVQIAGLRFAYTPLAFSQVNLAGASRLVEEVRAMLRPEHTRDFIDLYCGYGLFALSFAAASARVTGIESSAAAVQAAVENARRQKAERVRFHRADITPASLDRILRGTRPGSLVLLDPPRGGVEEGVIESIASLRPLRVVHLFCNIDLLPRDADRWRRAGYAVKDAVVVDMFPGTTVVEAVVTFGATEG